MSGERGTARQLRAVAYKELLDAARDRRALLSALVYPLVGPVMMALMFFGIERNLAGEDTVELAVAGAANAPGMMTFLREHGVEIIAAPADPEAAIAAHEHEVVLAIEPAFSADFRAGKRARVQLYLDGSATASASIRRRISGLINAYSGRLAGLRLLARGVDPAVVQPLDVELVDLATPRRHSANLLHIVALFVILAVFVGGMQVAIDTTAGERERGSLEALLLNPVPVGTLVAGKWLVASLFGAVSALLTLLLAALVFPLIPMETIGLALHVGPVEVAAIALIIAPLAPLAAASQVLFATFARSFKEAQTYLSLLLFVPMMPGFAAQILGFGSEWWMFPIPALGQQVLIGDLLRGDAVSWAGWAASVVSCGLLTWACIAATSRLFRREGIIFAGQ